ncbi:M48 family metallopeptidase [Mangrovicoccus algicola]|uniref:M48 family metallopeptidase n=1 Tax=Mangrovicoccus algicola TaxID=2771008 RepID=A0A8J7CWH1_9RHOB|nr:SprT family zinc-dependent metalloprotease [Mangrovicoccus algicola]MBE3639779.1 M48 family metallopeptidase [Mangrovicoccus algicola]
MSRERLELSGASRIEVELKRSARARRLSLRISRLDGRVTLTAPPHVPAAEARAFLEERGDWVRHHLGNQPPVIRVAPGVRLPVEGAPLTLVAAPVRKAERHGDKLRVGTARAGAQVRSWLTLLARDRLAERCDLYAARLGRSYAELALRDTRSRWGSCSSQGRLMFSWRLIMAPRQILDYVAAHEVAHLAQMNHSAVFWAEVARLHPGYAADRRWLRENGAWLHRYRFDGDGP